MVNGGWQVYIGPKGTYAYKWFFFPQKVSEDNQIILWSFVTAAALDDLCIATEFIENDHSDQHAEQDREIIKKI